MCTGLTTSQEIRGQRELLSTRLSMIAEDRSSCLFNEKIASTEIPSILLLVHRLSMLQLTTVLSHLHFLPRIVYRFHHRIRYL